MLTSSGLYRTTLRCKATPRFGSCYQHQASLRVSGSQRFKSSETGENKTGHITAGKGEGILFLDNVFPLDPEPIGGLPFFNVGKWMSRLMRRLDNPNISAAMPKKIAERALQSPLPINIIEVHPRHREGGVFVKFTHKEGQDVQEIEETVRQYLTEHPIRPWFNPLRQMKAFLVQGKPWVEDLYRNPSPRVKVEFVPPRPGQQVAELPQEDLYSLFRRYGKMVDIKSQPTDSKDLPRYAYLRFNTVRHAIRAKNCMHGSNISDRGGVLSSQTDAGQAVTKLKLTYDQKKRAHYIWDWLVNHPRLVIPLVLAIFGTITVTVFDP